MAVPDSFRSPDRSNASVRILQVGSVGDRVRSTVGLIVEGDSVVVIDPGMSPGWATIDTALRDAGFAPADVTDVVLSHHHPDHTMHAGRFERAWVHDHWARYRDDLWESRAADGVALSPSIYLVATPGHTPEDITTAVGTPSGLVAFTHLWWNADGPTEDPLAADAALIHHHRARVLDAVDLIVPGHGAPFAPDGNTPS